MIYHYAVVSSLDNYHSLTCSGMPCRKCRNWKFMLSTVPLRVKMWLVGALRQQNSHLTACNWDNSTKSGDFFNAEANTCRDVVEFRWFPVSTRQPTVVLQVTHGTVKSVQCISYLVWLEGPKKVICEKPCENFRKHFVKELQYMCIRKAPIQLMDG